MLDDFDELTDLMIKANDGDLDGIVQSKANDFFHKHRIDTSMTTHEIMDELYDKLGESGIKVMQDILGDFAKS
jgi:hypothetical protein